MGLSHGAQKCAVRSGELNNVISLSPDSFQNISIKNQGDLEVRYKLVTRTVGMRRVRADPQL